MPQSVTRQRFTNADLGELLEALADWLSWNAVTVSYISIQQVKADWVATMYYQ